MDYVIAKMDFSHLDQVEEIEKECFPDPWSRKIWEETLSEENAVCLAARTEDGGVLGYISFTSVLDEGELHNLAVRPAARRRGVASALLDAFRRYGRERGLKALFLEVRASNLGAAALYEKQGYRTAGIRKNYYLRPREDAVIMRLELTPCCCEH